MVVLIFGFQHLPTFVVCAMETTLKIAD